MPGRTARGWPILIIAGASLLVCGPLLIHGPLPLGSDIYATCHYLQGFMRGFGEGDLYPRWTASTNQDLGAPSFVLLAPLTYYGAGAASWLTGSILTGLKLYLLAVALLAGAAFYALAREWIGAAIPAAISAGIYLLLPYHVLDRYQRFALSETTAFVFFPLILLFARRLMERGRSRDFAGMSLSYAGLVCAHIVSALSFSLMLGIWLLWEAGARWRALARPALALVCGLLLAAPALVPAVVERAHANIAWTRQMPNGDFRINFIFRDDLLPGLGIKDPVKPPVLKSAHAQLALALIAAGIALAGTAPWGRRTRADILALAAGCLFSYFLQLEISTPIWRLVPELPSIQFPWRLQTLMVLTAALLCGLAVASGRAVSGRSARVRIPGPAALVLALALIGNLALAWQNSTLKPFEYDEAVNRQPFVVNWIEPAFTPVQFEAYRTLKQTPVAMPQASFSKGNGEAAIAWWGSSSRRLNVTSASGGTVALRLFWFPGWTATIDGAPLDLRPAPRTGVVTFESPPGSHEVALRFASTPVRRAARLAALAGIVLTALLAWAAPRLGDSVPAAEAG